MNYRTLGAGELIEIGDECRNKRHINLEEWDQVYNNKNDLGEILIVGEYPIQHLEFRRRV